MHSILMLLSNPYRPDARVQREARALIKAGYKISLIAWDREGGYPEMEEINGLTVRRVRMSWQGKSMWRHFLKLRSFWRKAVTIAQSMDFDAVHCHDMDTLAAGIRLKKRAEKLVFDAHEIYPFMVEPDVPTFVVSLLQLQEKRWLRKVDQLVTTDENLKNYYSSMGMKPECITIFMNTRELIEIPPERIKQIRDELRLNDKFAVLYIGALEPGRFIEDIIRGADLFPEDVVFVFGGYGSLARTLKKASELSSQIKFLGFVHPDDVLFYSAASDLILSLYDPSRKTEMLALPGKVMDAMVAGTPVIINREQFASKIVKKNEIGVVTSFDFGDFKRNLLGLKDDDSLREKMGKNARELAEKEYNYDIMAKRLVHMYSDLLD